MAEDKEKKEGINLQNSQYSQYIKDTMEKFIAAKTVEEREAIAREAKVKMLENKEVAELGDLYDDIYKLLKKPITQENNQETINNEEEVVFFAQESTSKHHTKIPQRPDEITEQTEIDAKYNEIKNKKFIAILGEMMKAGLVADLLQTAKDFRYLKKGASEKIRGVSQKIDDAAELYGQNKKLYGEISKIKGDYKETVDKLKEYYAVKTSEKNTEINTQLTNEVTATEDLYKAKTDLKAYKKTSEYKSEIKSDKYKKIKGLESKIVKATKEHRLEDVQKMTEELQTLMEAEPKLKSIDIEQKIAEYKKARTEAIDKRKELKKEARQISKEFKEQLSTEKSKSSELIENKEKSIQKQSVFGRIVGGIRTRTAKINGKAKMKKVLGAIGAEIVTIAGKVPDGLDAAKKGIGKMWQGAKEGFENLTDKISKKTAKFGENAKRTMAKNIVKYNSKAEDVRQDAEERD